MRPEARLVTTSKDDAKTAASGQLDPGRLLSYNQSLFSEESLDLGVSNRCVVKVGAYIFGAFTKVEVHPTPPAVQF